MIAKESMPMPVNTLPLNLPLSDLASYCRRNSIAKVSLFGSALRDDFGSESDIDLLVTFDPDADWGDLRLRAHAQ